MEIDHLTAYGKMNMYSLFTEKKNYNVTVTVLKVNNYKIYVGVARDGIVIDLKRPSSSSQFLCSGQLDFKVLKLIL